MTEGSHIRAVPLGEIAMRKARAPDSAPALSMSMRAIALAFVTVPKPLNVMLLAGVDASVCNAVTVTFSPASPAVRPVTIMGVVVRDGASSQLPPGSLTETTQAVPVLDKEHDARNVLRSSLWTNQKVTGRLRRIASALAV